MTTEKTEVVFRRWKKVPKSVIALFPYEIEVDSHCMSYEHIGQHSAADYAGVIDQTIPAEGDDVDELTRELLEIGYNLKPITRISVSHERRARERARKEYACLRKGKA